MSQTIATYDAKAKDFADSFEAQTPTRGYELVATFFEKEGLLLDVGTGSGRDVAYFQKQGYQAEGLEPSVGLLQEARRRHPECSFRQEELPHLKTIESDSAANIWCCAVIMHLPEAEIVTALMNLLGVCKVGGRILLSFRGPGKPEGDQGRQFTNLSGQQVAELLESLGGKVLHLESVVINDILWHAVVAEKSALLA